MLVWPPPALLMLITMPLAAGESAFPREGLGGDVGLAGPPNPPPPLEHVNPPPPEPNPPTEVNPPEEGDLFLLSNNFWI